MQDAMAALEQTYMCLQCQVNLLPLDCEQAQRDSLNAQLVAARSAYLSCVNKEFQDDDPQVVALAAKLRQQNQALAGAVESMGEIATVLDQITTAVHTATTLASLVTSG